jgi:hypothetical protein
MIINEVHPVCGCVALGKHDAFGPHHAVKTVVVKIRCVHGKAFVVDTVDSGEFLCVVVVPGDFLYVKVIFLYAFAVAKFYPKTVTPVFARGRAELVVIHMQHSRVKVKAGGIGVGHDGVGQFEVSDKLSAVVQRFS